ncbi:MAG TPA: DUF3047 domain-containing protein [Nitrospirales bacterium]|nr:DUF3047 domain-containing protein [Nitrospirales bacterium]
MDKITCAIAACLVVGHFSAAAPGTEWPDNWRPLTFANIERGTAYILIRDGASTVVKATSDASASGMIRQIRIDPKAYPVVAWRWRVENVLAHGDPTRKDGDDYPARLYITFAYDPARASLIEAAKYRAARLLFGPDVPFRAVNYIWDRANPIDAIVPNPYTDWTQMIVVESGGERLHQWIAEERNLYDDYRRAFHEEPPMITGVAIMTDTDNTRESAVAFYGDIVFKSAR